MASIPEALSIALNRLQAGDPATAENIYRQVVQAIPEHAETWSRRGLALRQMGRQGQALACFQRAAALDVANADYLVYLGVGSKDAGDLTSAAASYARALTINEAAPACHYNMANLLLAMGRNADAERHARRALALDPRFAPAYFMAAGEMARRGDQAGLRDLYRRGVEALPDSLDVHLALIGALSRCGAPAAAAYRLMLARRPDLVEAWLNLGLTHYQRGDAPASAALFRRAVICRPDVTQGWNNLGAAFNAARRGAAALACYRVLAALDPGGGESIANLAAAFQAVSRNEEALRWARRGRMVNPLLATAHVNLGGALTALGRFEEAIRAYGGGLVLDPADAEAWVNIGSSWQSRGDAGQSRRAFNRAARIDSLNVRMRNAYGNLCLALNRMGEAEAHFHQALIVRPDYEEALNNLGAVHRNRGRQAAATACFRRAVQVNPTDSRIHSNMLLTLCYQEGVDEAALRREHEAWAQRHADPHLAAARSFANPKAADRRLRIGYVSPDLRVHAAAYFLEPMFERHDHEAFEIFCYAEVARPDAMTERLRGCADHWRSTVGVSDDAAAAAIRADGIDVLIDLAGHTGNNRLGVFARKPAPVQATWLGYATTTGMRAMDYIILDPWHAPLGGDEAVYTERVWRLPEVYRCYRPPEESPPVGPSPMDANGHITFGSLNAYVKVTEAVIAVWAATLRAVPNARLMIIASAPPDEVAARFASYGIESRRIRVEGKRDLAGFLDLVNTVDIALDPFPHTGGTTTLHSLWMGVPVVTLAGRRFSERGGVGILGPLGMGDLVAEDFAGYVDAARRLAGDSAYLRRLRAESRERLRASAFVDAARFTRQMEDVYRGMWLDWLRRTT